MKPTQEQIDEVVSESRRELASGQLFLVRAPVIVALADDLRAAREENDAMAALLEDGPHHDDDECDADFGATECRWHGIGEPRPHEPCWRHRRLALLAARAKRMSP